MGSASIADRNYAGCVCTCREPRTAAARVEMLPRGHPSFVVRNPQFVIRNPLCFETLRTNSRYREGAYDPETQ
jgi:hypothetical protein